MIFKKFKDLIFIEKVLCKSGIKCPKIQEIRDVVVNGQATLKCLQDKGNDRYKLGCYIRGELLSKKTAKLRKLKKWAVGKKQGFLFDDHLHTVLSSHAGGSDIANAHIMHDFHIIYHFY